VSRCERVYSKRGDSYNRTFGDIVTRCESDAVKVVKGVALCKGCVADTLWKARYSENFRAAVAPTRISFTEYPTRAPIPGKRHYKLELPQRRAA
jgi:hypothetical protein